MLDLRSKTLEELEDYFLSIGEKKFRAKQVYEWINKKNVTTFDEMSNLSKDLREKLSAQTIISEMKIVKKLESSEDGTIKYLFEMEKDTIIESVLMRYSYGNTVCVSTQVGCRMGCKFCASTIDGVLRNLTAGEICAQIYEIQKEIGDRISNVVLMGSGEPFDNYDNVVKFLKIINSKEGLEIGQRHITISTCGLVDKIQEFAFLGFQANLAISLHAPNDEIREAIMPVAKRFKIDEIIHECIEYSKITGRRVTYEYALIKGINDSKACATQLGEKLRGTLTHVNLIPMNEIPEIDFLSSDKKDVSQFAAVLSNFGIETTVRRKLGSDINGACGQLRRGYAKDKN